MEKFDRKFIIWLAGFVDGEGCVRIGKYCRKDRNSKGYTAELLISNTNFEVLYFIKQTIGAGNINCQKRKENDFRKDVYQYRIRAKNCRELLAQLLPFLKIKGQLAKLVIEMPRGNSGNHEVFKKIETIQENYFNRLKNFNLKGRREVMPNAKS